MRSAHLCSWCAPLCGRCGGGLRPLGARLHGGDGVRLPPGVEPEHIDLVSAYQFYRQFYWRAAHLVRRREEAFLHVGPRGSPVQSGDGYQYDAYCRAMVLAYRPCRVTADLAPRGGRAWSDEFEDFVTSARPVRVWRRSGDWATVPESAFLPAWELSLAPAGLPC